ncbi:energy transducer TonB [Mucilaginibacter sp. KACC 22063]|uniref:energy transducer TonB n=1 Tax=Mucilaginibacter sp. KACC 22063 TaxID=3025666 RepID=UPI00236595CA|nr:energy transducer TonB [Mucilaginibacter sp. KACC 22063]WDF57011.1 TonB family protein [Mucilaginibacter sp. KACC 22063]
MLISKFDLYKSEWLELVFENRNKNYGAYELRSHHAETTLKALGITVFSVVAAAVLATVISRSKTDTPVQMPIEHKTEINLTKIHQLKPPPESKPAMPHSVKPLKPTASAPSVVIPTHVTSEPVNTDPPTHAQIATSTIGSETSKGTGTAVNVEPVTTGTPGGTGTAPSDNTPLLIAEVSPEPVGGMAAWSKFLQKNLRYPDTEVQGRVFLTFVVERDGSLSNIKVVKGVSPEIDNEAVRVLKMAPKWNPGKQAGQPVRVQFNIPITFQLNN